MADIKISLNNIRNTSSLYVDELGAFTVRRLGAGEELDLSDKFRRIAEIYKELQGIDFTKFNTNDSEDLKAIEEISDRAQKLTDEINEIDRFKLATYKRCFTHESDPSKVDELINSLTDEERTNLFNQLFDIKPVEAPELAVVPESETTEEPADETPKTTKKVKNA